MKRYGPRYGELQPVFTGRLGPSKAQVFKRARASIRPPDNGVSPLAEAPTAAGWWAVKYPTTTRTFMLHFSEDQVREMEGLHADNLAFYPFTGLSNPDKKA